ncbi:MAG TPA: DUF2252 domain-containing protein [Euzebyales bacterium]|nr:DUF2252 domain-containing protein [Euzebyales bacterium]
MSDTVAARDGAIGTPARAAADEGARRGVGSAPWLSPDERAALGRDARAATPRSSHAAWEPSVDRPDPVAQLVEQAEGRVPDLVPIRYGRMLVSPLAFYRGAANIMASDLATTPASGLRVQLCGDAHLSNFGGFGSPERDLVFDINDFDETLPGPWEWDVKRLAASMVVAGRDSGLTTEECRGLATSAVGEYRTAMRQFAEWSNLEVWYARLHEAEIAQRLVRRLDKKSRRRLERNVARARTKDSMRAFAKLTHLVDGEPRIVSDPPLIVPMEEISQGDTQLENEVLDAAIGGYYESLDRDRRRLLDGYRVVHSAHKVVGVGSVGTRAWIMLLLGRDGQDPLFLQFKQAQRSVLAPHAGRSAFLNEGRRVVEGQRLLQAASDILLGWTRVKLRGQSFDFHVRQLWDWKASADVAAMKHSGLDAYGRSCGWTLAHGHARSGDRIAIASYLGRGCNFDAAVAAFAVGYADQNERDYQAFVKAVESGRLDVQPV